MNLQTKLIYLLITIPILGFIGYKIHFYAFHKGQPKIEVLSLEDGSFISGDTKLNINLQDDYKVADISIYLDGKPLATKHKVNKKKSEYEIMLNTAKISNGSHKIKIDSSSASYNKGVSSKELNITIDNLPLYAELLKPTEIYKVFQGKVARIQFQSNKVLKSAEVRFLSKSHNCFRENQSSLIYECFIPIECTEIPGEFMAEIEIKDFVENSLILEKKINIQVFNFKKQKLVLDAEKVKHEDESGPGELQFEQDIEKISLQSPAEKLWRGDFCIPIPVDETYRVTTEFGVTRTTQERGLRQHKALDLYNRPKCVVWAPQDGIIVMKSRYALSGNTIVIDHGHSILTLLFHLDSFSNIEVGDKIRKGDKVGTLGKTGYATGYHLHWEMRVNNIAVDPMQWIKNEF